MTGATGFLGGHLAAALHRRGLRVRVLARQSSDVAALAALGLEVAHGDLDDPAALARAAAGQRLVFHCAARVSDWGPREEFFRVNVEGTRNVIAACQAAGVERLVHSSSLTVHGLPRDGRLVDEQTAFAIPPVDPYTDSKIASERLVRDAHGEHGLATTVVRCGVIWGPGDSTIVPRIVALLRRGLMVRVNGGTNRVALAHVRNLCEGLFLAATVPGAAGQVYQITDDEPITGRDVLDQLAAAHGTRPPRLSLPFAAVYGVALGCELAARAVRRPTPPSLTRYGVRLVACDCRYDLGKARRELGYRPLVTFRQGIAELAAAGQTGSGRP